MIPRIPRISRLIAPAAATALVIGLVGCAPGDEAAAPDETERLTVVVSTDVWASVVRAVAGDAVEVQAIIDDPSLDPHSYESTPADAAAVIGADLVVYNGGGYDGFIEQILEQAQDKPTVNAFAVAQEEPHGHGDDPHQEDPHQDEGDHAGEGATHTDDTDSHGHDHADNEHVWYDLPVVAHVAEHIAEELGELLPDQADRFTGGAAQFDADIDDLQERVSLIAEAHGGTQVAATEPVAFHLLEAAGLDDVTPHDFVDAVERDTDPPAAALAATRDLMTERRVAVLIYNSQTGTPVTEQVRAEAEAAGIPVVQMSETLPPDTDYIGWMSGQIDALSDALG